MLVEENRHGKKITPLRTKYFNGMLMTVVAIVEEEDYNGGERYLPNTSLEL